MGNCVSSRNSCSQSKTKKPPPPYSDRDVSDTRKRHESASSGLASPSYRLEPKSTPLKKRVVIPMDLVIEILSRLRSKPLMRFRCVCKSWNLITHDPRFISHHFNMMRNSPGMNIIILPLCDRSSLYYFAEDWYRLNTVGCENRYDFRNVKSISNSCDGLICVYNLDTVYVMNPSINKSLKLPEPSRRIHSVAICHDTSRGDYKLVCAYKHVREVVQFISADPVCIYEEDKMGCIVYTLGSSSWRAFGDFPLGVRYDPAPVVVDGFVFWSVKCAHRALAVAVSFDIKNENFDTIEHPRGSLLPIRHTIVELGGYLCTYERFHFDSELVLWILTDYCNREWTKYVIDLGPACNFPIGPITIRGAKILLTGFPKRTERFDVYNLNTKKFEQPLHLVFGDVVPYVESLISPITIHESAGNGIHHCMEGGVAPQRKLWWQQCRLKEHDTSHLGFDQSRWCWRQFEGFNLREGLYGERSPELVYFSLRRWTYYNSLKKKKNPILILQLSLHLQLFLHFEVQVGTNEINTLDFQIKRTHQILKDDMLLCS